MLHVLFVILKIIGILLAVILALVILVLAVPIRYSFHLEKEENASPMAQIKVAWFGFILSFKASYIDKTFDYRLRIFGHQILGNQEEFLNKKKDKEKRKTDKKRKKEAEKRKKEKQKQKKKQSDQEQKQPLEKEVTEDAGDLMKEDSVAEASKTIVKSENKQESIIQREILKEPSDSKEFVGELSEPDKILDNKKESSTEEQSDEEFSKSGGDLSKNKGPSVDEKTGEESSKPREGSKKKEEASSVEKSNEKLSKEKKDSDRQRRTSSAEKPNEEFSKTKGHSEKTRKKTSAKKKPPQIREKISFIIQKIKDFREAYAEYNGTELLLFFKECIIKIMRHILPRKLRGFVRFGFDDPSTTGMLTGIAAIFYPKYEQYFSLEPEFQEACFAASCKGRGRIHLGYFLYMGIHVLLNADVRRLIKKMIG